MTAVLKVIMLVPNRALTMMDASSTSDEKLIINCQIEILKIFSIFLDFRQRYAISCIIQEFKNMSKTSMDEDSPYPIQRQNTKPKSSKSNMYISLYIFLFLF